MNGTIGKSKRELNGQNSRNFGTIFSIEM